MLQYTGIPEIILQVWQPSQDLLTTSWDKPMGRTPHSQGDMSPSSLCQSSVPTFSPGTHHSEQGYRSPRKSTGNHLPLTVRSRTTLGCASPSCNNCCYVQSSKSDASSSLCSGECVVCRAQFTLMENSLHEYSERKANLG